MEHFSNDAQDLMSQLSYFESPIGVAKQTHIIEFNDKKLQVTYSLN